MKRGAIRAFLAGALVLAACGKTNLANVHPHLLVTPAALAFGDSPQQFPKTLSLLLENGGQATLSLGAATLDGPQAAMFKLGTAVPAQLVAAATATIPLIFTPTAAGAASATLHLASDDPDSPVLDVPVSGSGTLTGGLSVAPAMLAFGRVGEGEAQVLPLTLSSLGPADLYISALTITPASMGFALVGSTMTPATLGAGKSAQIAVRYSPQPGAEATSATLTISSSDPRQPSLQVSLTASVNHAPIPVATGAVPPAPPLATSVSAGIGATVILDGTASSDSDGDVPLTYRWTLRSRPEGSAAAIVNSAIVTTQLTLDVAGIYTVALAVTDSTGLESLSPATLQIQALPPNALLIELSWDQLRPDLDLHLLQTPTDQLGGTGDCGWTNPDPAWFSGGQDDNPRYQGDQLGGYGPEAIDWKTPQPGTFGLTVVYRDANGLAPANLNARLRIFSYGVLTGELTQALTASGQIWNAGTLTWPGGKVVSSAADAGTSP